MVLSNSDRSAQPKTSVAVENITRLAVEQSLIAYLVFEEPRPSDTAP